MRILLVEDDKVLADALSRALVQSAHAVDSVSTGEEADHALGLAIYDLAILDIGLPGLSGLEVLKRLRARKSTIPGRRSQRKSSPSSKPLRRCSAYRCPTSRSALPAISSKRSIHLRPKHTAVFMSWPAPPQLNIRD